GKGPDPTRPPRRDRPGDLLLQRLEEAGCGGEREDPKHRPGAVAVAAERATGGGQEQGRRGSGPGPPQAAQCARPPDRGSSPGDAAGSRDRGDDPPDQSAALLRAGFLNRSISSTSVRTAKPVPPLTM